VAQGCSANVLDVPLPRIEPFKISIDEAVLLDLRDRIRRTRWPDQVEGAGWSYGTDGRYLRELLSTWAEDFDWRVQERQLNGFAHYRVQIDGLGVHFVHERGEGPDPLPIVLTHGWPSTFVEHLALVPLLTDPLGHGGRAEDAFDVVVTSMPGFGFSDRPTVPGVFESTIADTWCRLMRDGLGYERFGAHGSDVGSGVTIELARRHPDRLLGIHLSAFYLQTPPPPWPPAIREFFAARERERVDEGAYSRMQATKPQSLAYGLNDSPAGLAGWIIEHFRGGSDCGGDVETRFNPRPRRTTSGSWSISRPPRSPGHGDRRTPRPDRRGPAERAHRLAQTCLVGRSDDSSPAVAAFGAIARAAFSPMPAASP
jgi:pimeloyl-ACP methyl ester carboxylesterase